MVPCTALMRPRFLQALQEQLLLVLVLSVQLLLSGQGIEGRESWAVYA